jgi:hypothetical protein
MKLHGRKKEVIVTIDINTYVLLIDSANKVVKIQYTEQTTLRELRDKIDHLINELGFVPVKIVSKKVKQFKF